MANVVTSTVIHNGARNVQIEVVGILDTSDFAQADITIISALTPAPGFVRLDTIQFSVEDGLSCRLWWHDTALTTLIAPVQGRGKLDFGWFGGKQNPKNAGYTGDIMLSTAGWATLKTFTLILDLIKCGV